MTRETSTRTTPKPGDRVRMTVTAYLSAHIGGFYDMHSLPAKGRGEQWSIPEYAVDEASVTVLPPESLDDTDWDEIRGVMAVRLGQEKAAVAVAELRRHFERRDDR